MSATTRATEPGARRPEPSGTGPIVKVSVPRRTLASELRAIKIVWRRELIRFSSDRLRIVTSLVQPLLFLFVLGSGLQRLASAGTHGVSLKTFLFPGILCISVMFIAMFQAASIVWDAYGIKALAKKSMPAVMAARAIAANPNIRTVAVSQIWAYGGWLYFGDRSVRELETPPRNLETQISGADAVALYETDLDQPWIIDTLKAYARLRPDVTSTKMLVTLSTIGPIDSERPVPVVITGARIKAAANPIEAQVFL